MGLDDLEWADSQPALKTFKRRTRLIVGLDDLLAEKELDKVGKTQPRRKRRYVSSDDEDDGENVNEGGISQFIEKCANEVGDGSDMLEPPKWGENVFGCKKVQPECVEPAVLKAMAVSRESLSCFLNPEVHEDVGISSGNWILHPLVNSDPVFYQWIFHTMAYTENRHVERSACKILCDSAFFDEHENNIKLADILDAFRTYGYEGSSVSADSLEESGPPANIISLLDFIRCCFEQRNLKPFTSSEAQELFLVLARCLLDRKLVALSCLIQDSIEALVDYFEPEEWNSCFENIAAGLARISKDVVNVLHVSKRLRGGRNRVEQLHREISFQVLSTMSSKELRRCPEDIMFQLKLVDPRNPDLSFVELLHMLNLADLWLKYEPSFKSKDEATFITWMGILKNLSVRISCGDYRTYATKVRNRAAFLISIYSNLTVDDAVETQA